MCITLLSTAHPDYPLILLNNRDEHFSRPTARAEWWDPPNNHVLGGRDLQRAEHGTWLGITKDGRLANLTNFRDDDVEVAKFKSRGGLVSSYLTQTHETDEGFVRHLVDDIGINNVGGFTLLFGKVRATKEGSFPGLAAVSNRTSSVEDVTRIGTKAGEVHGLSNSYFGDLSWPKVIHGEQLLRQAIMANPNRQDSKNHFIESLFDVLSVDTLPKPTPGEAFQTYTRQLRTSILIPPIGGEGVENKPSDKVAAANGTSTSDHSHVQVGEGAYGTQTQTVILVNRQGHVTYVERKLYDTQGKPIPPESKEKRYEFNIEGWDQ